MLENRLKRYFVGFDVMLPPGIKSVGRSMEKTFEDYEGDVSRLLDTARASVVAEDLHELDSVLTVVLKMIKEGAIIIRRIKNRFKRPTSSGYRDIMFNVCLPHMKEDGASDKYDHHVAELQLHLRGFFAVKNGKGERLQYRHEVCIGLSSLLTFGTLQDTHSMSLSDPSDLLVTIQ